jgi:hypothetical protein
MWHLSHTQSAPGSSSYGSGCKLGKVDVSLAFDSGSNNTVVTKEYAEKRKLKKIGSGFSVIFFDSPELEMGNLYEVLPKPSGKQQIMVCAVSVFAIYVLYNAHPRRMPIQRHLAAPAAQGCHSMGPAPAGQSD